MPKCCPDGVSTQCSWREREPRIRSRPITCGCTTRSGRSKERSSTKSPIRASASCRVKKLSAGWREVVEKMVEGEQRRAWIPDEKLIIDTELVGIVHPPPIPADRRRAAGRRDEDALRSRV